MEFPRTLEEMRRAKVEFRHGHFKGISIEAVDVFNDGLVVTSRVNSDVLDEFIADVLSYMAERWQTTFTRPFPRDKLYESAVTFYSDKELLKPLAALNNISRSISNKLNATTGAAIDYYPFGIGLSADHAKIPSLKPIPFRIERREGVDFGANIYFSAAPLKTDDHIEIINEWEKSV
jgi:hypothetical protein